MIVWLAVVIFLLQQENVWFTCMSTVVKVQKFSISISDANLLNILVGKMVATY